MDKDFGFPTSGMYRYTVSEHGETMAVIDVDYDKHELIAIRNYSDVWYKLPFGINPAPSFEDFCYYMTTRVVSASYDDLNFLYEKFAPPVRDRYHLLLAMHGRVVTDNLEIVEEKLC